MYILERIINYLFVAIIFLSLTFSNARLTSLEDRVYVLAEDHGFDFFTWIADATWVKLTQSAIDAPRYFSKPEQHQIVLDSINTINKIEDTDHQIDLIFSNPSIKDPRAASDSLRQKLATLNNHLNSIASFAEATLEMQVTTILNEIGLTSGGQPIPWVLYHITPLPQNLVISRRDKIETETNYVVTTLTTPEATLLESIVDNRLSVSSLVVDIGGLAAYPTMIMRTGSLDWLSNTIAHEWIHIYLSQHPLGMNYSTQDLRTMNETTASIAGSEIGRMVLERYYPELISNEYTQSQLISNNSFNSKATTFDFRTEMHTTRITTDKLLAEGKITEAETYMEQRRKFFWDNGYPIRKINQAYFAFFGSYADTPGGAAGEDPVGPAVRALRSKSSSLKEFLVKISAMTTFAELQVAVGK